MKSLASERTGYVALQARVTSPSRIHLQGKGVSSNRDYGVAVDINLPANLCSWLNGVGVGYNSLYPDSNHKYFFVQAVRNGSQIHIQVPCCSPTFNRNYGATFDVSASQYAPLAQFVDAN